MKLLFLEASMTFGTSASSPVLKSMLVSMLGVTVTQSHYVLPQSALCKLLNTQAQCPFVGTQRCSNEADINGAWGILRSTDGLPWGKTISVSESFLQWAYIILCGLEPYLDQAGDHCTIRYAMFHSSSRKWNSCQWSRPSHVYCSHTPPAIRGTAPNLAYGWLYHAVWITQL